MQDIAFAAIISLPGSEDRLNRALASSPAPLQVIPGVDGRKMRYDEIALYFDADRALARYGRPMTRGEIGCSLAHFKALKTFLSATSGMSADTVALICEDDVMFEPDGDRFLHEVLSIGRHELTFLVPLVPYTSNQASVVAQGEIATLLRPMPMLRGAGAYLISRRAARSIVSATPRPYWIADNYQWFRERGIDVLTTRKGPIGLQNVPSTIDGPDAHRENDALRIGKIRNRWRGSKSFMTRFGSAHGRRLQRWHRHSAYWARIPPSIRTTAAGGAISLVVNDLATGHTVPQRLLARFFHRA